jgi:hypothetical protein
MYLDSQSVGLLGRMVSPVARLLPRHNDANSEKVWTDIHTTSGTRTQDLSVERMNAFHALDRVAIVFDPLFLKFFFLYSFFLSIYIGLFSVLFLTVTFVLLSLRFH